MRLGVPSLVIVREPAQAVASLLVRETHLTASAALKSYICFHRGARPHRRGFVVATFEQVTGDFGAVVERLNAAFGSDFRPFEHTDANVGRVFETMAAAGPARIRPDQDFVVAGGWPLAERDELKRQVAEALDDPGATGLLAEATALYEEFRTYACGIPMHVGTPECG